MTPTEYRTIRESIGTREEVADRLGIDPKTIQRREAQDGHIPMEAELAIVRLRSMTAPTVGSTKRPQTLVEWYALIMGWPTSNQSLQHCSKPPQPTAQQ